MSRDFESGWLKTIHILVALIGVFCWFFFFFWLNVSTVVVLLNCLLFVSGVISVNVVVCLNVTSPFSALAYLPYHVFEWGMCVLDMKESIKNMIFFKKAHVGALSQFWLFKCQALVAIKTVLHWIIYSFL